MTKPHKHAQILKAIADGLPMQRKDLDCWIDCTAEAAMVRISMDMPTRIKPEPKPDVVFYSVASMVYGGLAKVEHIGMFNQRLDNNLKLTFDGETGKLKSAEVLK